MLTLLAAAALAGPVDRVPQDFPTLQDALDRGTADVIHLGPGTWAGARVDRPVHLVGEGAILTSGPKARGERAALILGPGASGSTLEGLVFDCESDTLDLGVWSSARTGDVAHEVEITRNSFLGCVQAVTNAGSRQRTCATADVDGGRFWSVHDNVFDGLATRTDRGGSGGGVAVLLYNTHGADVYDNVFTGAVEDDARFATSGVGLAGCVDCTVSGNTFQVTGGRYWYSAVTNAGAQLGGAVASRNLLLADDDAFDDSAPWLGVSFVSRGSVDTEVGENLGVAYVDHEVCGDGALYTTAD